MRSATRWFGVSLAVLGACDGGDTITRPATPAHRAEGATPTPAPAPAAEVDEDAGYVDDPAELGVDPMLAAKAKVIWDTRCAPCHGDYGTGKGPQGAPLDPPPRNFHEGKWQRAAADEHIKKVILEGGPAVGLSPAMTAHPELRDKPELVEQLVVILRGLPHWKPAPKDSPGPSAPGPGAAGPSSPGPGAAPPKG